MSNTQTSSSHGKLIAAVVAAALVVVLALVSAFIWPGWALNKGGEARSQGTTSQGASQDASEPTTPSIDAVALPDDASELLKAMPDAVLNFARTKAAAGTSWSGASPVEEYTLTYSTGTDGQEVTLEVAQWSQGEDAQSQYDNLTGAMTGKELGSGNVKVSGEATGAYSAKTDPNDETKAIAVWRNDTVVFQATGAKDSVCRFYQQFPL
ncbi:hypothetical protein [Bifidobacterium catenulatum]|uniref:hypothetical protein n=1 Tax=Bifidobacterium catenulatum TaxID=1686 RepID=UPI002480D2BF|nr:hypothetical protein [Bifidobacterium catenulatum]MDH7887456.1 hypothetical protein [Bifidobacterium catenulatum subsp. kashiwanohense]